jgi:hypothetical protein
MLTVEFWKVEFRSCTAMGMVLDELLAAIASISICTPTTKLPLEMLLMEICAGDNASHSAKSFTKSDFQTSQVRGIQDKPLSDEWYPTLHTHCCRGVPAS